MHFTLYKLINAFMKLYPPRRLCVLRHQFVCLLVSKISQKLADRVLRNLAGRQSSGRRTSNLILGSIRSEFYIQEYWKEFQQRDACYFNHLDNVRYFYLSVGVSD